MDELIEIQRMLHEVVEVKRKMKDNVHVIQDIAKMIIDAYKMGKKVLLCGNGGSAGDAQHLATEMVGRFRLERAALPAIALTTNTSTLTAIGNDYGFELVFARQVEAFGEEGDVLICISTSGKSPNVLRAAESAKRKGLRTIGFTGEGGGALRSIVELCLRVPSSDTPRIQEMHITAGHIICDLVERNLYGRE
jgi:D-sedoheptulose 7-phosphate isomerase